MERTSVPSELVHLQKYKFNENVIDDAFEVSRRKQVLQLFQKKSPIKKENKSCLYEFSWFKPDVFTMLKVEILIQSFCIYECF
jgi:hypothetical protein